MSGITIKFDQSLLASLRSLRTVEHINREFVRLEGHYARDDMLFVLGKMELMEKMVPLGLQPRLALTRNQSSTLVKFIEFMRTPDDRY